MLQLNPVLLDVHLPLLEFNVPLFGLDVSLRRVDCALLVLSMLPQYMIAVLGGDGKGIFAGVGVVWKRM